MVMKTSRFIAASTAFTLLLASACGGTADNAGGGDSDTSTEACAIGALDDVKGPVEVTIWHNFTALGLQAFNETVTAFNASQDKVKVVGQNQGVAFDEVQTKVEQAAVDKELPGLAVLEDTKTQWAADSGLFAPAQACIEADPEVKAQFDDLIPIVRSSYEVDGTLYPVSFSVYTALVYFNQAHFEEAGLDPNVAPTTLEEVYEFAKKIKAAKPDIKPLVLNADAWLFEWFLSGVKQELVNNDNGRQSLADKSEFANDRTIEILELFQKMKAEGLLDVVPGTPGQVDHLLAMAQQTSSMVMDSTAAATTVAGVIDGTITAARLQDELGVELPAGVENLKLDLRLSVGPIPGLEKPGQGQIGGAAWYMPNTNSREVQAAAWEFLKYLNSPEVQAVWSTTGSNTPAFAATTKQESLQTLWKTTLGGQWQQVGYEVLAGVDAKFPGPLIGPYSESRTAIRKALDQTLLEDQPIKPALDETDAAINKELELYAQDVGA